MSNEELILLAKDAMKHAYAPYSKFQVGAALLTQEGSVYTGCNIENGSYGATICAERVAIFKAISEGQRSLKKIAIVCSEGRKAYPCGICLQVMSEFLADGIIILEDTEGITEYRVMDMLPHAFRLGDNNK